ncbi:MAG: hypothetical protein IKG86_09125 [Paludibacteraceae bacterium]|nr:hypothetical protein [Paludibacteraceae bacterium]
MEEINKHIGQFDFWSIFGTGAVTLTSYLVAFRPQIATFKEMGFPLLLSIGVALSYTIGLILYCISSLLVDCKILKLSASDAIGNPNSYGWMSEIYYKRYLEKSNAISESDFHAQYDILKLRGVPARVDKLHTIHGMTRGIATGYLALALIAAYKFCSKNNLSSLFDIHRETKIVNFTDAALFTGFFVLSFAFYITSKKYLYRWIEWILAEYDYLTENSSGKK